MGEEQSAMELEIRKHKAATVFLPRGRITETEAYEIERELAAVLAEGEARIVVDLAEVSYVTSSFLGALMAAMQETRDAGGFVRLAAPQPLVAEVLATTKLDKLLAVYPSVEAALEDV